MSAAFAHAAALRDQAGRDSPFQVIASFLHARSGLSIGPDKLYLLETRLAAILRRENLRDLAALADRLRANPPATLANEVVEAMTTNESLFFRDDKPFAHLRSRALPALLAARPPEAPIRIWSAAAATGQEAYSIAMVVADLAEARNRSIEIIGTDIAREPLGRARAGIYSQFEVQRGLPVQMLVRHFKRTEGGWQISEALRERVTFREWNLLADHAPLGRFDVVFCRNVLIYFDPPTKARVLAGIARQMQADGYLYLGGAETVFGVTDALSPAPEERCVYRKAP